MLNDHDQYDHVSTALGGQGQVGTSYHSILLEPPTAAHESGAAPAAQQRLRNLCVRIPRDKDAAATVRVLPGGAAPPTDAEALAVLDAELSLGELQKTLAGSFTGLAEVALNEAALGELLPSATPVNFSAAKAARDVFWHGTHIVLKHEADGSLRLQACSLSKHDELRRGCHRELCDPQYAWFAKDLYSAVCISSPKPYLDPHTNPQP